MAFIPTDVLRINPRTYDGFVGSVNGNPQNFNTYSDAVKAGAGEIKPAFKAGYTMGGMVQKSGDAPKAKEGLAKVTPATPAQPQVDMVKTIEDDLKIGGERGMEEGIKNEIKSEALKSEQLNGADTKPMDFIQTQIDKVKNEEALKSGQAVEQKTPAMSVTEKPANKTQGMGGGTDPGDRVKGVASISSTQKIKDKQPSFQVKGMESNANEGRQKIVSNK